MSAKKLLFVTLIASLLTACGGNTANQPALPGDGTYDDSVVPSDSSLGGDPYGGDAGLGGDPTGGLPTGGATDPATGGADGQIGDPTGEGFTLKGLVADMEGKPITGAKVSIGSQTTLSNDKGEFEIAGITDSQVWVDVTKDGYEAISRFNVTFTTDKPTADKEFKLAKGTGTGTTDGGTTDGGTSTPAGPALSHEGAFGGPAFKSVSAMAVSGNTAYVVGVIDKKFWFDRAAIVVFNTATGEETGRIGDVLFSKVPKSASSIAVVDGQVVVSDGSNRYTFTTGGDFVKKASGGNFPNTKIVTDSERGVVYTLKSGSKVDVNTQNLDGVCTLGDVSAAKAIGLDEDGGLIVLDDGTKAVHKFTLE